MSAGEGIAGIDAPLVAVELVAELGEEEAIDRVFVYLPTSEEYHLLAGGEGYALCRLVSERDAVCGIEEIFDPVDAIETLQVSVGKVWGYVAVQVEIDDRAFKSALILGMMSGYRAVSVVGACFERHVGGGVLCSDVSCRQEGE